MKPAVSLAALLAGVTLWPAAARTAEPSPVDPDFLEFLGSIDSEGDGWGDYLGSVDLDKRTPPPAPAPVPPVRKPGTAATPPVKEPVKGAGK